MREAGMSLMQIAQRVGHHHSTVSRIVNKHRLTNDFRDLPRSIDDVVGTIANGKLCVLVLVDISLQVFLNDSQHISDDFGLFLQIATDAYDDNRTLLMLSVTLLKLFLLEEAQSWCGDE
jgi:hypothetical protein